MARLRIAKPQNAPKEAAASISSPSDSSQDQEVVVFEYIKSAFFRVVHVDGAIGGFTPNGNISFALFSERPAIPKMQIHRKNPDSTLGDVIPEHTVVRPGIIREMDVDVVMSRAAATSLRDWLSDQLARQDQAAKDPKGSP